MVSEEQVKNLVQEYNANSRGKTFAEFIAELLAGQFVEIYMGDSYEEIRTEQVSTSYAAVFCGKVVTAFKECLVLNSAYYVQESTKVKTMKLGNLIFINERAIRGLTQIDGNGIMDDMFLRSKESLLLKEEFIDKT
jgi:hypothetical protein